MSTATEGRFGGRRSGPLEGTTCGRLPRGLAEKTEETPEEEALRKRKEGRLMHAGEWSAVFAFAALVVVSLAVSLYVAARWLQPGAGAAGFWESPPVRMAAVALLAGGGFCIAWGRFAEPHLLRVRRVQIKTSKLSEDAPGPRLFVFVSDLHIEGPTWRLGRLVATLRRLAPDVILLGGDYLNDDCSRSVEALARTVEALAEIAPVYALIGNADEARPVAYQTVASGGAKVLVNEPVEFPGGVTLWGLRWLDEDALRDAASRLDRERLNVCLTHAPGMIPEAARAGFDFYLTGHTHGGQVRLPLYGALVTLAVHGKRFERGRYELPEGMIAYVSAGLGLEGGRATRVRFMCPPEVVLVEFLQMVAEA